MTSSRLSVLARPILHSPLLRFALLLLACGEPDPAPMRVVSAGPEPVRAPRTSTGCQAWREATCDYVSRCGMPVERCSEQYQLIECKPDGDPDVCALAIDSTTCGQLPEECRPTQVAASVPAVDGCMEFVRAVCESATVCKLVESFDECAAGRIIDCQKALGLRADFAQCLLELDALSCSGWLPPSACMGAILLGPS